MNRLQPMEATLLIRKPSDIKPSEITPQEIYTNRRAFLRGGLVLASAALTSPAVSAVLPKGRRAKLEGVRQSEFSTDETPNSYTDITTYNNYYEFGVGKDDPYVMARNFVPRPWSIEVSGHAEKTGVFDLDDIIKPHTLEERIYRLRCVEAWSMVVPWIGVPLADVIKQFAPTSNARYVAFETLLDERRMPGQRYRVLRWPYAEGLTIAEAANPLPILAVGLYGEVLPNQNGAPVRLVVPWKYGFKSIKGIVKISFREEKPVTSWNRAAPHEYGFYANVNPEVNHPRWSQARERRIGAGDGGLQSIFGASKQETVVFNGYGEHVAHLYDGLDLRKNF